MTNFADASFDDASAFVATRMEELLADAIAHESHAPRRLRDAMAYSVLDGGKRLRPFFVLASHHLFSDDDAPAWRVAIAVEMIHCYSLVHDDLPAMDDDDLRRGRASCHKHYDEATAILVGDALQTLAFAILADERAHPDARRRVTLIAELARRAGAQGMVGGQMADLLAEGQSLSFDDIAQLQRMKTGDLLMFAITAGALLNDASDDDYQRLARVAQCIGLAFQIRDDILDVQGSSDQLGKTSGKDEASGKATFVHHLGLAQAEQKAASLIDEAVAEIAPFGARARLLQEAAHFIIGRHA